MDINRLYYSPNYSTRLTEIKFIIIHYTEVSFTEALKVYCDVKGKLSPHYFIKDDGEILQLVDDNFTAWHAGVSSWKDLDKINDHSIGIELDNSGREPFSQTQMISCIDLCKNLMHKHNIEPHNILGHSDIAPSRKIDPGLYFNWADMANCGIGLWVNSDFNSQENSILYNFGDQNPDVKDLQNKLKILGYSCKLNGIYDKLTSDIVRAFKAHFNSVNISQEFYWNLNNVYNWDLKSDKILNELIKIL